MRMTFSAECGQLHPSPGLIALNRTRADGVVLFVVDLTLHRSGRLLPPKHFRRPGFSDLDTGRSPDVNS